MDRFAYVFKILRLKACIHGQICIRMQNLHTYAYLSMCTHLLMYTKKFARMQRLGNLHLVQTKCRSDFAYMQNFLICKSCPCVHGIRRTVRKMEGNAP